LHRLFPLLKLPVFVKVYAGIGVKKKALPKAIWERSFCFSLNRFRSTAEYTQLCRDYKRTYTAWDRAFHYFINHILQHFHYLVTEAMLPFWIPHLETFANLIKRKLVEKTDLIFNLFAIEVIQLTPFGLFLIQVVSPPLTLQISLLSHGLSFLVLVSTLMLRDLLTLTISSSSQPLSPL